MAKSDLKAPSIAPVLGGVLVPVFSATLDSKIESVESAAASVDRFAQDAGFEESDRYFISLAVREIVTNAIKHGNRFDPSKKIGLRISGEGRDLTIEVTDEGEGFQLENVPDPLLAENRERTSGRGIMLTRAFMDDFSVERRSQGGMHVKMVKRLPAQ